MTHFSSLRNNLPNQILLFLMLVFSLSACSKETNKLTEEALLNEQEMTALLEGALTSATQGLIADIDDAVFLGQTYNQKTLNGVCGEQADSTISRSINHTLLSADYTLSWNWTVNCNNNNIPISIRLKRTLSGQYESQRLSSDDQANGEWLLDGLLLSPVYKLSGIYIREGDQRSKVRDQQNFSSLLKITVSEIQINKDTQRIKTGAATFDLTGMASGSQNFAFNGTIAFLGDGQATVTVNGNTYHIDLY